MHSNDPVSLNTRLFGFGILRKILLCCSVQIVGTSRLVRLSGNIKSRQLKHWCLLVKLFYGRSQIDWQSFLYSFVATFLCHFMSVLWRLSFCGLFSFSCWSPFDCFATSSKSCSIQRQENGRPTVNFRSVLFSFSACLLSKTRTQIQERIMANFDCPWHWKRPEIFAFPFPVVLSVGFASAFLSSVLFLFFFSRFRGRWI